MVSEMAETSAPRRRNWFLIVSVLINVALIAAVATVAIRIAHRDDRIGSGGVLAPRTLMEEFPDRQAAIQKAIDAHAPRLAALRKASLRTRFAALNALSAADFSVAKNQAALDAVAAADAALEAEYVRMEGDGVAALSAGQRAALADRIKARGRSWQWRMLRGRGAR